MLAFRSKRKMGVPRWSAQAATSKKPLLLYKKKKKKKKKEGSALLTLGAVNWRQFTAPRGGQLAPY
jgi:hypothetical protein